MIIFVEYLHQIFTVMAQERYHLLHQRTMAPGQRPQHRHSNMDLTRSHERPPKVRNSRHHRLQFLRRIGVRLRLINPQVYMDVQTATTILVQHLLLLHLRGLLD
jgi:hypothetical protein